MNKGKTDIWGVKRGIYVVRLNNNPNCFSFPLSPEHVGPILRFQLYRAHFSMPKRGTLLSIWFSKTQSYGWPYGHPMKARARSRDFWMEIIFFLFISCFKLNYWDYRMLLAFVSINLTLVMRLVVKPKMYFSNQSEHLIWLRPFLNDSK